jgi:ABC-type transport system substrate-binding protein
MLAALSLTLAGLSGTEAQAPRGTPGVWFLGISPALPPGDLLPFRQALAHGIDRTAVARAAAPHAVLPGTQPAGTIEHPSLPGHISAVRPQTYDPARARELFAQSGWTRPISILTTNSTNNWVLSVERALVDSLQASTGATVTFAKVASFAVLTSSARAGTVPIWLYGWESRSSSMPLGLARAYFMSDPEVRALVERGAAMELEQLLLDRALIIPIVFYLAP